MSDLDKYRAKPNPWFEKTIEYVGEGEAEFSNPNGWIRGETHVSVNGRGDLSVVMQIDDYGLNEPLAGELSGDDKLQWLLRRSKPHKRGTHTHYVGMPNNKCNKLTVTTKEGIFSSLEENIFTSYTQKGLEFALTSAVFRVQNHSPATYWIMPLSNFIHESLTMIPFPAHRHILDHHPLRIWKIAGISDDLSQEEFRRAIMYANSWNRFVPFEFAGQSGFIESLHGYSEIKKKLTSGSAEILTTSVMVGDCTDKPVAFSEIFDWLPLDFLHMLSLASGSLVGTSWIELRDENGALVKRIHLPLQPPGYRKAYEVIRFSAGISRLLSNAPEDISSQLRTALRLAVKADAKQYDLNDRMLFLFVALDTLTQYYRKSHFIDSLEEPQKSLARSILDSYEESQAVTYDAQVKSEVEDILKETMQKLRKLGKSIKDNAKSLSDSSEEQRQEKIGNDIIDRVSQVVRQALQNRRHQPDESEAILLLLKEHDFHDLELIENHKPDWKDRVGMYRNQLVHEGFFASNSNPSWLSEALALHTHLLDVLLRVLLRKLNYEGEYRSPLHLRTQVPLDWVQPDTPWSEFGY